MPSASAAQVALLSLAAVIALAAAGCNGYMLFDVQRVVDAVRPLAMTGGVDNAGQGESAPFLFRLKAMAPPYLVALYLQHTPIRSSFPRAEHR